jgi:pimeloyl-ACP methyl ester carboxylesterase
MSAPPTTGFSEEWTTVDGLRVRYLHSGHGSPLVLVHGLLGYSANWRRAIPLFAQHYEVFAPDLPGSGLSDCNPQLDCRLPAAAGRLHGFLDAVGIKHSHLIGSSYGGATAVIAASLQPSRFNRLVLVSPANPWSRTGHKRLFMLRLPVVSSLFPPLGRWAGPMQRYFLRRMYGDPSLITEETIASHLVSILRVGILEHGVGIARTWSEDMRAMRDALPKAAQIPTLLVWGSRDRTVDPASVRPLSRQFDSAQVEIIEGAGHLPYEECPEKFTRIVLDFLVKVGLPSANRQ